MRKYLFPLPVLLVILSMLIPNLTFAYFSTNQTATVINDSQILFTVTYKFGFKKYNGMMPIGAVRGLEFGNPSPYLGYKILDKQGKTVIDGTAYSIVLSDAKVVNNSYYIPKGVLKTFTLVTLYSLPKETSINDVSLRVTSLPFMMQNEKKEITTKMNPSELQYYTTPIVHLSK